MRCVGAAIEIKIASIRVISKDFAIFGGCGSFFAFNLDLTIEILPLADEAMHISLEFRHLGFTHVIGVSVTGPYKYIFILKHEIP